MISNQSCRNEIERMLKNSQTKVIAPIVTLGLVRDYSVRQDELFSDAQIKSAYESAVRHMKDFLGHSFNIGAKYYDAYGSRLSRYGVLEQLSHLSYRLSSPYADEASELSRWIPEIIKEYIDAKLGIVPLLGNSNWRMTVAESSNDFLSLISQQITRSPANFEIFSFAVIKVHLEMFACKIYRDTRASAKDHGVDISTNFGVVYQVKKLKIYTESEAQKVYAELKINFDKERLQDGNVILVIDDLSKEVKQYLINMKIQSITREEVLRMAANFEAPEDRQKVLRIVFDEFGRDYSSRLV